MTNGKLPTGIKPWSARAQQFAQEAERGYIGGKEAYFNNNNLTITDTQAYIASSEAIKKKVDTQMLQVKPFIQSMDKLISLVDQYGSEWDKTAKGREMNTLWNNAIMSAKEIYALGALTWPDMSVIEWVVPNPTGWSSNILSGVIDYADVLRNSKQAVLDNANSSAQALGISVITPETQQQTQNYQETVNDVFSNYQ